MGCLSDVTKGKVAHEGGVSTHENVCNFPGNFLSLITSDVDVFIYARNNFFNW